MLSSITLNNKDGIALTPVQKITAKDLHQMIRKVIVNVTNVGYLEEAYYLTIIASVEKVNVTYNIRNFKAVWFNPCKSCEKNLILFDTIFTQVNCT